MSKILHFMHGKSPCLTFETEELAYDRDGDSILITAQGQITQQDGPSIEAMFHGFSCHLEISEGGTPLLSGNYEVTLLLLEPDQLAARLRPE